MADWHHYCDRCGICWDESCVCPHCGEVSVEVIAKVRRAETMKCNFHMQLRDRLEATGDTSPSKWNLMADVLEHAACEATRWTNRADDARRIPDMLDEAARFCRQSAKSAGGE